MLGPAVSRADRPHGAAPPESARMHWRAAIPWQVVPGVAFLGMAFLYPLLDIVMRSFGLPDELTVGYYRRVFSSAGYLEVFWNTIVISLTVTLGTLVLGYPTAYVMSSAGSRTAALMMVMMMVPFLTSILARMYGWIPLLAPGGVVASSLSALGITAPKLLYNRTGVVIGMIYTLLPYMILTNYSVMRSIDRTLVSAASSLGANEWRAFRFVFLPLSAPGIIGGSLLVFVLSIGYFVTPKLMGGDGDQMVAMILDYLVQITLEWKAAAAISTILLVITIVGYLLYLKVAGFSGIFTGSRK